MFRKYLRRKQYAKIKLFIKSDLSVIQKLLDHISEEDEAAIINISWYKAQIVLLKGILRFIEEEEGRS